MPNPFSLGTFTGVIGTAIKRALAGVPNARLGTRYELYEPFEKLPQLNAAITIATNLAWEATGLADIASTDFTFAEKGGVNVATATTTPAANDHAELTPHLDAAQTAWAKAGIWGSENSVQMEVAIRPASLVACAILVGLKEDTTIPADMEVIGSDDNGCFFFFSDDTTLITGGGTKWCMVENVSGVDTSAVSDVVAVTTEDVILSIRIGADLRPAYYINGKHVRTGPALTTAINLIPYIAIMTDTTAVKNMDVRYCRMSRLV